MILVPVATWVAVHYNVDNMHDLQYIQPILACIIICLYSLVHDDITMCPTLCNSIYPVNYKSCAFQSNYYKSVNNNYRKNEN